MKVDTSNTNPRFIKTHHDRSKKRSIVTVEYKGEQFKTQKSKSEGCSFSSISVRPPSNGSLERGISMNSEINEKKLQNDYVGTESEFGYTSSKLIIRRVDSTFAGCEI